MAKRIIWLNIYEYNEKYTDDIGKDWEESIPEYSHEHSRIHRDPEIGPASYFPAKKKNIYYLHGERLREEKC